MLLGEREANYFCSPQDLFRVCPPPRCSADWRIFPAGLASRQVTIRIQITSAPQLSTEAQVPAGFRTQGQLPSFKKSLLSTARARTVVIRRYKTLIYIAGRVIYTPM